MISIKGLNKYFNKNKNNQIHVINDSTLELPATGLITFLGESGCGKTTLLNTIAGLDSFNAGEISYENKIFNKYKMQEIDKYRSKNIGVIFQNYNLLQEETVYENLRIALEIANVYDEKEVFRRIEYALSSVGLMKFRKKTVSALSGGQQQRVAIARALLKHNQVIIADEPTGNLDSETSLEIMNILKKISKTSLVLMVTHDKILASAYSDRIVNIKDGKIVGDEFNISTGSISKKQINKIYLKDMNLDDNKNVKIYHTNSIDDLEIRIVEHNNTFFVECNKNVKLISDSSLELIDDHYKDIKIDDTTSFTYDDSFYKDIPVKGHIFKQVIKYLKESLIAFFGKRKIQKLFNLAFVMLGLILAVINISLADLYNKEYKIEMDKDFYKVSIHDNDKDVSQKLYDAFEKGYIDNIYDPFVYVTYDMSYVKNSFESYSSYIKSPLVSSRILNKDDIFIGSLPKKGEVVLGYNLADDLIKEFRISFEELIKLKITINNKEQVIVGVSSKENECVYAPSTALFLDLFTATDSLDNYYNNPVNVIVGSSEYEDYKLLAGGFSEAGDNEALFPTDGTDPLSQLEYLKSRTDLDVIPVGIYDGNLNLKYIMKTTKESDVKLNFKNHNFKEEDYKIVEGKDLSSTSEKQAIVPIYQPYKIGDMIGECKVVGKYVDNATSLSNAYVNDSASEYLYALKMTKGTNYMMLFYEISDIDALYEYLGNKDIPLLKSSEYYKVYENEMNSESRLLNLIFIAVLFSALAVYITFTMRAKMINDIYEIGVLRSIGSSRRRIIAKYAIDTIVIVSFTTLLGYLLTTFVYSYFARLIVKLGGNVVLVGNYYMTYLFVPILYLLYLSFGLLPITMLLRKTPAEIIAKYDI